MRRLSPALAVLALLVLLPAPLHAQFSISGGVNLASFFGDDVESAESKPGLNFGGSYDLLRFGRVTVVPELHYVQKGAEDFQARLAAGQPAEVSLDYVEVPVLLRIALPTGGTRFTPYLHGGPVFAWQLDCSVKAGASGADDDCDELLGGQDALEETLREYEQGLLVGGGVRFDVLQGYGALDLNARYHRGLSRLSEGDDGPEVKNQGFTVLLGYAFGTR